MENNRRIFSMSTHFDISSPRLINLPTPIGGIFLTPDLKRRSLEFNPPGPLEEWHGLCLIILVVSDASMRVIKEEDGP